MLQRRKRLARQGFTLIELMIVIAIIGVLAAIAVPNFQAARQRANIRACYANQKTVAGAIEMYNLDFNTSALTLDSGLFTKLQTNGYLQSVPRDPGQGLAPGANYTLEDQGLTKNVKCAKHGFIQAATGP